MNMTLNNKFILRICIFYSNTCTH